MSDPLGDGETRMVRATVSGSFRRHMPAVQEAVYSLTDLGVEVLSPSDPRVVDAFGNFLFVASDHLRTIRLVEQRHLAAIRQSDFLWLADPEGYVGNSASLEIGFAAALGVPVYATEPLADLTLRQYVTIVPGMQACLHDLHSHKRNRVTNSDVLLDPDHVVTEVHSTLEVVRASLLADGSDGRLARAGAASVRHALESL